MRCSALNETSHVGDVSRSGGGDAALGELSAMGKDLVSVKKDAPGAVIFPSANKRRANARLGLPLEVFFNVACNPNPEHNWQGTAFVKAWLVSLTCSGLTCKMHRRVASMCAHDISSALQWWHEISGYLPALSQRTAGDDRDTQSKNADEPPCCITGVSFLIALMRQKVGVLFGRDRQRE